VSKIARALLSVSDKTGLVELGRGLARLQVEILSTGGTARALREAGVSVREVSDFTGVPEILDGRVKTLHPRVHGGILGRDTDSHRQEMRRNGIDPIDLVVVNLYPFRQTVAGGGSFEEIIEDIDIGGPAMVRSAAKNHERVAIVVDPADYGRVLAELETHGEVSPALRFELCRKAFAHTAAYDGAIAGYLGRLAQPAAAPGDFPVTLHPSLRLARVLRYGENPHQKAAFYGYDSDTERVLPNRADSAGGRGGGPSLARAQVLQGKELSYNNLLDLDAAMKLCAEFSGPAAVITKHTNPCGAAVSEAGALEAYRRARETDPVSAFGGIVAINRVVEGELAKEMAETFLECIVAPDFTDEALAAFSVKKGLRLLKVEIGTGEANEIDLRSVAGGVLVQTRDATCASAAAGRIVSQRPPTERELADLDFAWRVAKHVKSNAIVFAADGRTLGIGAGQMSRVDSVRVAVSKARVPLERSVLASDAFFPFRDGVDEAAKAGVTAIIEPGGSLRDQEVIAAADERGIAMIFSGERHFRH
jgi:phosphoribosylaminoimidazolecarboxamide formyltransferase / IMP cyclohydrolase